MDLTTRRDSKEALFADIMTAPDGDGSTGSVLQRNSNESAAVERRKKCEPAERGCGRRVGASISPKKLRPQSMIALPSSPGDMLSSSMNSFLGRGLFARPKAFFSSEQQLAERVEEYNKKKDDTFKLKLVSATSQVRVVVGKEL